MTKQEFIDWFFNKEIHGAYFPTPAECYDKLSVGIDENEKLKKALLELANKMDVYVDFSDKTYDGDKEAPMDAIGFTQYLINYRKQTNELNDVFPNYFLWTKY